MSESALRKKYQELSTLGQRVFQLLALSESEICFETLQSALKACRWTTVPTTSGVVTQTLLRQTIKQLTTQDFAKSESYATYVGVEAAVQDFGVQQAIRSANFPLIVNVLNELSEELKRDASRGYRSDEPVRAARRMARIAFYRGDVAGYESAMARLATEPSALRDLAVLNPFDAQLFEKTPDALKPDVLVRAVRQAILKGEGSPVVLELFDAFASAQENLSEELSDAWVQLSAARGDLVGLREMVAAKRPHSTLAAGCLAFLTAQHDDALAVFETLTSQLRKTTGQRNAVLPPLPGLMHLLLLLRKTDPKSRAGLKSLNAAARKSWPDELSEICEMIPNAVRYADASSTQSKSAFIDSLEACVDEELPLAQAVARHVGHWFMSGEVWTKPTSLSAVIRQHEQLGLEWLVALYEDSAVLNTVGSKTKTGQRHGRLGTHPMLSWIEQVALWQRKLDSLRRLADGRPTSSISAPTATGFDERMIWELDAEFKDMDWSAQLRPIVQKVSGKNWTKGRPIALERLYRGCSGAEFAFLTDQDRAVCHCLQQSQEATGYYRYTETVYSFDDETALVALVGHPLVFTPGNRTQPLEITAKRPQLVIQKKNLGLRVVLEPRPYGNQKVVVVKDGAQRLVVVAFTDEQLKLAGVLDGAIDVPLSGEAEVLAMAKSLTALVSVQSDITFAEGTTDANVKTIAAEARPQLHLLPFHAGVRAEFFVQPFGDSGPFFTPGLGGENVFAELLGESVSTRRDLKREKKLANEIVAASSSLANVSDGKLSVCEFAAADEALEMLLEIEPLRASGKLVIHWPQGQSLRIAGSGDASQLSVRIERDRDWFSASGELIVDETLKLDMLLLMELVSKSTSRFVPLSDGRFLALTERLRQRVAEFAAFGERTKDSFRFPQIRAAALSDLDEWCTLKADKHWKACVKRIRDAGDVVAEVPSTLNAELRDYQIEGFRWLSRLAHWGAGACLADDMGLGKTLQAIALLLRRGADGPALVIAPTSVCFNWEAELRRFAPTLNPRSFGAGDRDAFFAELGPRDVVITSYGLLYTETERLQAVHWHTAILDEAQAIKNTLTKRSQAAMSLTADFRLIMTGTPIENHLGELWNLFQFINPGLLGSIEQYQQRFALPIERDQNRDVRSQLKRLVLPFLLRRTKAQVLSELPPRIEVTVPVTMSDDEALLYEAARQRAVQQLTEDPDARGKHLRILAELMRLRRACCHPSLLLPDCGITGAKLTAFSETIDELIENRHKALVFSQFVDHLSILRAELDRKGVSYQYLDGSTPTPERQRRVEAFQNGEGDVFLISLKAGGTGLNLTAADYVLHMDPWWNPAVEDQASDRAHRLGQLRPVTIYRFITRGTIEEKILDLHATKRDLADSLLEGTDTTGRLSAEELLDLMR